MNGQAPEWVELDFRGTIRMEVTPEMIERVHQTGSHLRNTEQEPER